MENIAVEERATAEITEEGGHVLAIIWTVKKTMTVWICSK